MFVLREKSLCLMMSLFRNGILRQTHVKAWSQADFIKSLKNVQPAIVGRFAKLLL